jgi:1,4-alpha-glucan branching enzyme
MTRLGSLALVLHAHLPFVRHPEHDDFLEEDWLFEAITESYIPLLIVLQRLVHDGVAFKLTMSLTPTLCSMLRDPLLRARYLRYIDRGIGLARQEIERNRDDEPLRELSQFYFDTFTERRRRFVDEWQCDLVGAFRRLQETGAVEIIASAATHGFLPLLQQSPEALRAQVLIGRDHYRETFGCEPRGFWLPECGYTPALDQILQEANLRWFIIDAHGLLFGNPRPRRAGYAPCYTPSGPAAFARDRESSRQVWSAQEGYPGDPAYRDFYRDAGYDLPLDDLRAFLPSPAIHKFTGLKYHRVTGRDLEKEIYNRTWAESAADAHASHFLNARRNQLSDLLTLDFDPMVVTPFDAELFGHWWFEGPRFLDLFIRKAVHDQHDFQLATPSEYLNRHPTQQIVAPAASSWGENGHSEMWLDPANSWIYPHLHAAARRMTEVARAHSNQTTRFADRVLKQLARELLLAQSSDWAFLMKTGTAQEYATKRVNDHLIRFNRLYEQLLADKTDEAFLADCERRDNLLPNVYWRYYL